MQYRSLLYYLAMLSANYTNMLHDIVSYTCHYHMFDLGLNLCRPFDTHSKCHTPNSTPLVEHFRHADLCQDPYRQDNHP